MCTFIEAVSCATICWCSVLFVNGFGDFRQVSSNMQIGSEVTFGWILSGDKNSAGLPHLLLGLLEEDNGR